MPISDEPFSIRPRASDNSPNQNRNDVKGSAMASTMDADTFATQNINMDSSSTTKKNVTKGQQEQEDDKQGGPQQPSRDDDKSSNSGYERKKQVNAAFFNVTDVTMLQNIERCTNKLDAIFITHTLGNQITLNDFIECASTEGRDVTIFVRNIEMRQSVVSFRTAGILKYVAAKLKAKEQHNPILFINVFYQPSEDNMAMFLTFLLDFQNVLDEAKCYKQFIVTGNVEFKNDQEIKTRMFKEIINWNGLVEHVATRREGHKPNLVMTKNVGLHHVKVETDNKSDPYSVYFNTRGTEYKEDITFKLSHLSISK